MRSGALVESYRYDLYGTPTYYVPGDPNARSSCSHGIVDLYAGERWIPELGLYDLRNRFLSPELGRFLQADPIGFKGDPSNLYRYCGNDSVNKSDPDGLYSTSALTNFAGGDWRWFNGGEVLTQLQAQQEQRQQAAGLIMANVERVEAEKGGLKVQYARSYPSKGPGGRPVVERALQKLKTTERGRLFYSQNRTMIIAPTGGRYSTSSGRDAKGNLYLFLDPTDSRFYDAAAYRAMSKHPDQIPPDSDAGRAAVIAHEFGHSLLGASDEPDGRNVRDNENSVRRELGIPLRRAYNDVQFPLNE